MVWRTLSESLITGGIVGREVLRFREQRGRGILSAENKGLGVREPARSVLKERLKRPLTNRGIPLGLRSSCCAYKSPYLDGLHHFSVEPTLRCNPRPSAAGAARSQGGDGLRFLKKRRYPPAKASFEQIC